MMEFLTLLIIFNIVTLFVFTLDHNGMRKIYPKTYDLICRITKSVFLIILTVILPIFLLIGWSEWILERWKK